MNLLKVTVRSFVLLGAFTTDTPCAISTVLANSTFSTGDENMWQTMRRARSQHQQHMSNTQGVAKQGCLYSGTTHFLEYTDSDTEDIQNHTYDRRYVNLKGQKLKVGVNPWPERLLYNETTSTFFGYDFDLIGEIGQLLNFTFSLVEAKDGQWGILKNNTWNGLVGMLVRNEVDMALSLAPTPDRIQYISFACHMYESEIKLWMQDPILHQEAFASIFDLLTPSFSWCLLSAFLVVVAVYTVSAALLSEGSLRELHCHRRFYENSFLFARPLLRQGALNQPISTTGRTLWSFWWWFCIILSVTYSGTIISSLANTRTLYPFTTVSEMLGQNEYKWGYIGNSSIQSFMEDSKQHHIQEIRAAVETFAKSDPSVVSSNIFLHHNKMTTEKYLFIGTIANPGAKNFISLRETLYVRKTCIGLPRNSILTSAVETALTDLNSFGILYKLKKKNGLLPSESKGTESAKQPKVTLHLVRSVFYVAVIGAVLSGVVLVSEFLHQRLNQGYR